MVRYLETQPGETGRVRAIDRDLKLHEEPKEIMAEFLPRVRLPLAMYEIFPEYFDVREQKTSDTQGEGHSITLQPERPSTIGETVAEWDPNTETRGARAAPAAAPADAPLSPRRSGESARAFNQRMATAMNFESVAAMWEAMPDLEKETKREMRAEAAEKRLKGPGRPPGPGRP